MLIGLSAGNVFTQLILNGMNDKPVIFALALPTPEILPSMAKKYRPDCIVATGRADYVNHINNNVVFPFVFRAILDTMSSQVNQDGRL